MNDQALIDELVGYAHGNFIRVQEILAARPDLVNASSTWGETPLEAAAQVGQREIARYLLDLGAPLDLCTAAMLGMTQDVRNALKADRGLAQAKGAHDIPVLYYPMLHGEVKVAELLLAHGADVNAGDGVLTPLHGAVLFNRPDMVRWLLDNGAWPGFRDYNGKSPLDVAEEKGMQDVAALLREAGG